jgi:perosamine synthetase
MVDTEPTNSAPGSPAESNEVIPLSVPHLDGNEGKYLAECINTNWVSSAGEFVDRFADEVASRVDRDYGVPVVNGTAALHLALESLGIGEGDEVIIPSLTFIAPANAVRYTGAHPVFVDVEPRYLQVDPDSIRHFLDAACEREGNEVINERTGRRVRALLPVSLLGHPYDVAELRAIARDYDLLIVEDASESLGAEVRGEPVGCHGDAACFSFNGNKIVTAGGGGMLVTDDANLAEKAEYLSTQAKDDPLEYVHEEIGYNYRLTNLQAAVGCAQLEQLDRYVAKKREIANRYESGLADVEGLEPMQEASWAASIFWLYTVKLDSEEADISRKELQSRLRDRGIQVRPLWQPLHESPAHENGHAQCKMAEELKRQALCLPCSVGLTESNQQRVIDAIEAVLSG